MDACPSDHRADLADSLPDHPRQLWIRVRAGDQKEAPVARGLTVRHQSCGEFDLHADPVWHEKFAACCHRHRGCLGHDHLVGGVDLAALPLGERGPNSVFRVGLAGDRSATVNHGDELGEAVIRLGLCCMFRDQGSFPAGERVADQIH
jgi:hypothetical protein